MTDPRRLSPLGVALLVAAIALGGWIGLRSEPADDAAPRTDGGAAGIAGIPMRTLDGGLLSLREAHAPTVVMISSETCVYCKAAFREMAAAAHGRPLRQLRVVTLEGAAVGAPMLQAAGVTGATLLGPTSPAVGTSLTFQIRGTPTFLFLDAQGHVRETLIGYPGSEGLRPWIAVMLGDAAAV